MSKKEEETSPTVAKVDQEPPEKIKLKPWIPEPPLHRQGGEGISPAALGDDEAGDCGLSG